MTYDDATRAKNISQWKLDAPLSSDLSELEPNSLPKVMFSFQSPANAASATKINHASGAINAGIHAKIKLSPGSSIPSPSTRKSLTNSTGRDVLPPDPGTDEGGKILDRNFRFPIQSNRTP